MDRSLTAFLMPFLVWPLLLVLGQDCPSSGETLSDIISPDIPDYPQVLSPAGTLYFLVNVTGTILPYGPSSKGIVFGRFGPNSNSWDYCSTQCLAACDSIGCLSFNIFTFQESDYDDCHPTCECRSSLSYYDPADYDPYTDTTLGVMYPSYTWTQHNPQSDTCPEVNVVPSDLPSPGSVKSDNGFAYSHQDVTGTRANMSSPFFAGVQFFGTPGNDSNSWSTCVSQCLDWCDVNYACQSVNVFTFQEADYAACEVTCQCRPMTRTFDPLDYEYNYPLGVTAPSWIFTLDNSTYQPKWYCPNGDISCCFDPAAEVYDPCLWSALDMVGYIQSINIVDPNENWVTDVIRDVLGQGSLYPCSIIDGCTLGGITVPDNLDDGNLQAYLAVVAARRYMLQVQAHYGYVGSAFQDFITTKLGGIISALYPANGPAISKYDGVEDMLGIFAGVLTMIAAIAQPELAAGATFLSGLLGIGGGFAGLQVDFSSSFPGQPMSSTYEDLASTMGSMATNFQNYTELRALNFTTNTSYAASLLDGIGGGTFLNTRIDPDWNLPTASKVQAENLLSNWVTARVFQGLGLFVHWEGGLDDGGQLSLQYPGQGCLNISVAGTNYCANYWFPVVYVFQAPTWDSDGSDPYSTRAYNPANNVPGITGLDWQSISRAAVDCQMGGGPFDGTTVAYPPLDINAFLDVIASNPNTTADQIPCLYNMPVCDPEDNGTFGGCVSSQRCCTGQRPSGWYHDMAQDYWSWDNFGLDTYCARMLGVNTNDVTVYFSC